MNLLLVREEELDSSLVTLDGRRAKHLLEVIRVDVGSTLRAGIVDRGSTTAEVIALDAGRVTLRLAPPTEQVRPSVSLVLAIPRPKVVSRVISAAASFGIDRLFLINAWRVERSYFSSPRLAPPRLLEDAWLGCEQGRRCHLPRIEVIASFRRYVEELDPREFPSATTTRIALHPDATLTMKDAIRWGNEGHVVLAVGPEGGFIQKELESWERASYERVRLGTGPLKTEVALAAALGQVALLSSP